MLKLLAYLKYFFYLSYNWNIKIAIHIIRQEIKGEKKYDIHTTGADELKSLEKKGIDIYHATVYMPASYDLLENIFLQLIPQNYHHFLDVGCGKGRVLCVSASKGFRKITGIDFSKKFCVAAEKNIFVAQQKYKGVKFEIINNDAFYFDIPTDVDCIFMFNPFDEIIMSGVAQNILKSFKINPRTITLIYCNPVHLQLFLNIGFTQIYHTKKLNYLEAVILELKPANIL